MIDTERFWARVQVGEPTDCWPWTGSVLQSGYGQFYTGGRTRKAHRVAWEILNGPIPRGERLHDTCICHTCDNPRCCNPAHLFLGSQADNYHDMMAKGRAVFHGAGPRGQRNGRAKLTEQQVAEIKRCVGISNVELGRRFGVTNVIISRIRRGLLWKHVPAPVSQEG